MAIKRQKKLTEGCFLLPGPAFPTVAVSGQSWWVLKLCAWGAFLHLSIYTISWSVTRAYCEWQDKKVERSCWYTRLRHWFPRQSSAANTSERLSGTLLVHLHNKTFYRQKVNNKLIIKMRYQSHLGNAAVSILAVLYISVLYSEKIFLRCWLFSFSQALFTFTLCNQITSGQSRPTDIYSGYWRASQIRLLCPIYDWISPRGRSLIVITQYISR